NVAQKAEPAVVAIVSSDTATPRGSGFLVTSDGYIVTNLVVAANAKGLSALIPGDSRRHDARLVDYDCQTGIAVLKVDNVSSLPTLAFGDPTTLKVGENAVAVGGVDGVTRGVISALHQVVAVPDPVGSGASIQLADVIYTDTAVAPTDAGGPLLNVGGQVVGGLVGANREPDVGL